jgi:iron complex outermembrane receptor protein
MKLKHDTRKNLHLAFSPLAIALTSALSASIVGAQEQVQQLPAIEVSSTIENPAFSESIKKKETKQQFASDDTAKLLQKSPGLSFYTGGGVSSLPAINGLADDRLKISVDGMTITSACPNHMNPALSYIAPAALSEINVYAGVVPVSQGGDSVGGAIHVVSAAPEFAKAGEAYRTSGNLSAYYRGNGDVKGASARASLASEDFNLTYTGNTVDASNYKDGDGKVVGASRYKVRNNAVKLAIKQDDDLFSLDIGWQDIPLQGFPNQAMDMTYNKSLSLNAAYSGEFSWGLLEARAYRQSVRHKMDILPEKGGQMPMDTDAADLGYSLLATSSLNENQTLRFGHEFHQYTLDDWWPALADSFMGPHDFWNIRDGKRQRFALFSELDNKLNEQLSAQLGARVEQVRMNTGDASGYHSAADGSYGGMMGATPYDDSTYKTDADAFNAEDHKTDDLNLDLTASLRYVRNETQTFDLGLSRKTRSPNLHERYTWSNEAMMAGLMNNWFGDLNSYVGDIQLKPEVAYSLRMSADWHDATGKDWQLKVTPYYTLVQDYINVALNTNPNPYNMSMLVGRQSLRFINDDAKLYGVDLSGSKVLGQWIGDWTVRTNMSYVRGKAEGGDNLYNIMPLNMRFAVEHHQGAWRNSLETELVASKDRLSSLRAEQQTAGYALVNLRTSVDLTATMRLDAGIDNLLDRAYRLPLGGLEYASANMMMAVAPSTMRGSGRSINAGFSIDF